MTLKTQVAHGLKWQTIGMVGTQLILMLVFTLLARILDPSAFGLVALVNVYLGFVTLFIDQGIGMALVQRQDLKPEHKDTAFWFNIGCAVILCLGTMLFAGPISALFKEPRLASLLRCASLGLVIGALSEIHATLFTKVMDFRRPLIRKIIGSVGGGAVGVGMALAGCGVWSLIGQQLGTSLTGAIFLWTVSTYRPSVRFSLTHFRELIYVSSSVFTSSFLWFLTCRVDQLIIGRFAGVPVLGLYSIASKFPDFAKSLANTPIVQVTLPALSQLQNDHARIRKAIYSGVELLAIVAFAIYLGLAATASDLLPFVLGTKWTAAAGLCSLLSLYALINTLQFVFFPAMLASGGAGKYLILSISQACGALVACLIGIQFGINYVVAGLIINALLVGIFALQLLRCRIGLSPLHYCKLCLAPALCSVLMVGAIWISVVLLPSDITATSRLICKIFIGGTVYLGCLMLLARSAVIKLIEIGGHAFPLLRYISVRINLT